MDTSSRRGLLAILVIASTALAGCSGVLDTGPSISAGEVQVMENSGASIPVNYSVDDYATILLEGPSGEVIDDERVGPDSTRDELRLGTPQGGTYTIALQQGGETQTKTTVKYAGPDPVIQDVEANWSGTTLSRVTTTVENTGDLPVRLILRTVLSND